MTKPTWRIREELARRAEEIIDGRARFEREVRRATKPLQPVEVDAHELLQLLNESLSPNEVLTLANDGVDAIHSYANLPEEGARDALNLLVNIIGAWVTVADSDDRPSVQEVIAASYDATPEEVKGWVEA